LSLVLARGRPAVVVAAVALVVGAGCADADAGPWAMRYAGHTVSHEDLEDELTEMAGNQAFLAAFALPTTTQGSAKGSFTQTYVAGAMQVRILLDLAADELDERGIDVSDDDLEALRGEGAAAFEDFSDDYRERIEGDVAALVALQRSFAPTGTFDQTAYNEWLLGAVTDADVEVSSRYGRWDEATLQVIPPDGPRPAPLGEADQPLQQAEPTG
jgi:hypothetical protein